MHSSLHEKIHKMSKCGNSCLFVWSTVARKFSSDSSFDGWTGCYCSSSDGLAVIACPAINGFHSVATYSWESADGVLFGENTPLLFCGVGDFKCTIKAGDHVVCREFTVFGECLITARP